MLRIIFIIYLVLFTFKETYSKETQKCEYWGKKTEIPCIVIKKTPNTSSFSEQGVNKITISKSQIEQSGAIDVVDILSSIDGLDLKQNGQRGQLTSLFLRGTNSNHTLVLLNGIPINDQSTTQGLHNFGQDFVQTLQKIEIYKGPSGSHFGPSAIGGAINFVTSIDYTNKFSLNGFDGKNNSINSNYTKIFDNGWHVNFKGSTTNSKNGSSRHSGASSLEEDGSKNHQLNLISEKWITDNLRFNSTIYSRKTKTHYDASSSDPSGYANDKMNVIQTSFNRITKNSNDLLTFHITNYDREYDEGGYFDEYDSNSAVLKAERNLKPKNKLSFSYGAEYKYDSAEFTDNGSWSTPSAKGYVSNIGLYANTGYKYSDNSIFSFYGRADNHRTTNLNPTYKINFFHKKDKFIFGLTHSTGLRNPSLYELYGNNGLNNSYKHVANPDAKPEKSESNELSFTYSFSDSLFFENTFYKSYIKDALLYDSSFKDGTGYTNSKSNLKQKGIENKIIFKGKNQSFSIFNTISSSKKVNGDHQLNRPDSTYGINYTKSFNNKIFGPLIFNYNYKHYGKVFDYAPTIKKVDSTDIMNMNLSKNTKYGIFTLNITNLLDEKYQRPYGYSQVGRNFRFGLTKNF